MSPDGRRVAFQVLRGGIVATPVSVIDRKTGATDAVANEYSPAFFWSPDGTKLLSLLPEVTPGRIWFRWGVWEDGSSFSTERFVPSLVFSRDYLQFFEQYAQSMRLWSPDGSAFVYAGEEESGGSGIWIQPATPDTPPVRLADGVVASWSPAWPVGNRQSSSASNARNVSVNRSDSVVASHRCSAAASSGSRAPPSARSTRG